jgi:hypothetical protein
MSRFIAVVGTILFSFGALAGAALIVFLLIDREVKQAAGVAVGTVLFAWIAWACRQDWRREQQAREFRAANSRGDP